MANTRDIRRRIKSVKSTAQITRAMQLVAASKMKKAQEQAIAGRAYASHLMALLANLKGQAADCEHPLLERRATTRELVVLITTDKGLCGGLNANLLRKVLRETGPDTRFVSVGRKGRDTLAKLGRQLVADFPVRDPVHFHEVKKVARYVARLFVEGEVDGVRVAFPKFVNTLTHVPTLAPLLPLDPAALAAMQGPERAAGAPAPQGPDPSGFSDYLFEPSRGEVFEQLLPIYVNYLFYQMVLEARASEHSSRMVAMKSATDNASEIVKHLTLQYNKVRQAAITNELLEIATAQRALD